VSYLHVYVDKGGNVASDVTESPNRPEDAKLGYGRLRVKNHTGVEITNIVFKKKVGIGANTVYDDSKSFVVQKVGPGSEEQYSSVSSNRVEEGNYSVFCTLADGSVVFNGFDFYLLPDDVAYQLGDNVINIYQAHISPPPSTIMYTVVADGGPPAAVTANGYTTTKLALTFSVPVSSFTFQKISMNSGVGSTTRINDYVYEVEITNPVDETATFRVTGTNVDSSEHQVHIYKKDDPPPANSFIPVTDVVVTNGESFTKNGTIKTIQWEVLPADATNKAVLWTLGEADGNLFIAKVFGTTPPYGLGADGKQHTDELGRVTVRSSWSYGYLNLAVIVKNGKAEGARTEKLNQVGQTVVDIHGNTVSVTIQQLRFDPAKDFVKVFRFAVN
jgi:hypothetical protein